MSKAIALELRFHVIIRSENVKEFGLQHFQCLYQKIVSGTIIGIFLADQSTVFLFYNSIRTYARVVSDKDI